MGARLKNTTSSPSPCRGKAREGVETLAPHDYTPILTFPLQGGRNKRSFGLKVLLQCCWKLVRQLSGDDAYERYLAHHTACHPDAAPLSRSEYFRHCERQKWEGVRRCC